MKEEQVERILNELVLTRKSFDEASKAFNRAIGQIRWNRINTAIQYALLAIVVVMIGLGVKYYLAEKKANCHRGNQLRSQIATSLDANAASIGITLTVITGASPERFEEYMEVYHEQDTPPVLQLRDC